MVAEKQEKRMITDMKNEMEIIFDAISNNESLARMTVAAFISGLNPTLEEMSDIKTAVSEAVTNAIIHGYENIFGYGRQGQLQPGLLPGLMPGLLPSYLTIHPGKVRLYCKIEQNILSIEVEDWGRGIANIDKAMEPLYTTKPELDRSGMGFAFMEAFMDDLEVESEPGKGTLIHMKKKMCTGAWIVEEE